MAVQKNFVVKNGIEVNTNLIFADVNSNKVGIATTIPNYNLHVSGGIGATSLYVAGISTVNDITINGRVTAGSSLGASGQYLISTGAGVSWASIPKLRNVDTQIASAGVTTFITSYTVDLLDVYINGVRLSYDEFTATDSATVTLDDACFGGETVEFVSYSPLAIGVAGSSIQGITVLEEGTPVGSALQITSLNFVGASVTAVGSGLGVTVYVSDLVAESSNYWSLTDVGIHTLSNVGLGTTNSSYYLEVGPVGYADTALLVNGNARVVGILTVGASSITLDGANNIINVGAGVTINGDLGSISVTSIDVGGENISGSGVTYITAGDGILLDQSTGNVTITSTVASTQWENVDAGINILSNVGIGTTDPTSALTVQGDVSVSGVSTFTNNLSTIHQSGLNPGIRLSDTSNNTLLGMYYDTSSTQSYLISDQKNLNIKVYSPQDVYILAGDEVMASFESNGPVSLYYDNVKKFETLGTGVTVTGTTFTNQLSVSGVSTLIGSVGIGTTNPVDGYDLTLGVSNTGIRTTSLKVYGYADINGLTVKGNSRDYTDNVIITQNPSTTFYGNRNVAIGDQSFTTPGAAGENVAIGYYALNVVGNNDGLNTWNGNTAVGAFAGQSVTTTLRNTFIGNNSGRYITTGGENTILGSYDGNQNGLDIRTSSNNVVLSDGAGNIRFYANSSGNVGLGTTNPTVKLEVNGSTRVGIDTSAGVILTSPNGTKYQLFVENDGTLKTVAV